MALPFDRQRQLELEAEAEFEFEQEQGLSAAAPSFSGSQPPPFARSSESQLGADYSRGYTYQAGKSLMDTPESLFHMGTDLYNLSMPIDSLAYGDGPGGAYDIAKKAGVKKTAQTVGGLAAGTAGAMALAPFGAGWGATLGPIGAAVGGLAGAGIGFGGGLLGFDLTNDAVDEVINYAKDEDVGGFRPPSEYAKDFIYNSTQAAAFSGLAKGASSVPKVKKFAEPWTKEGAERRVYEELNRQEPGYADKIDAELARDAALPPDARNPFIDQRSLGELIDSDVLRSAQRIAARTDPALDSTGTPYGRTAKNFRARNDAQLKYLDQLEQSPTTAKDTQGTIRNFVEQDLAAAEAPVEAARGGVDAILSQLPETIDKAQAGKTGRAAVEDGLRLQRGKVSEGFSGIGDGVVDLAPAKAIAAEVMPQYFKEVGAQPNAGLLKLIEDLNKEAAPITNMAGEPIVILDAYGQPLPPKPATYTMQSLQALSSDAIKILKDKSDKRSSAIAGRILDGLDQVVADAVQAGRVTPEQVASWETGKAARKLQGDVYESQGLPTRSVLNENYSGKEIVQDSAVLGEYFRSGSKGAREKIQNYKQATGETPQAIDALHRYVTDSFRRVAVNENGIVDAKAAKRWLDNHAEALSEMPELRNQLGTVEKAQAFLNEKFGDLKRSKAEVEKGALQMWLKDIEPQIAIKEMLRGDDAPRKIRATVNYIRSKGDPAAEAGLRRGVIEYIKEIAYKDAGKVGVAEAVIPGGPKFDGTVSNALLAKTLDQVQVALKRSGSKLFTDSQMKGFEILYKDKMSQLSVEKAKLPGSATAPDLTAIGAMKKMAGKAFLNTPVVGPTTRFIISTIQPVLAAIPAGKFQIAMEEALLNPRYARDLQAKATAKNITRTAQMIFKEEFAKSFGDVGKAGAAIGAAKAAPRSGIVTSDDDRPIAAAPVPPVAGGSGSGAGYGGGSGQFQASAVRPTIPKQQAVTSRESFPEPQRLLAPPSKGSVKKVSFNLQALIDSQAPETRARIGVESSGDPYAVSPKGAQGLSQLMPATAQEIARELGEVYTPIHGGMSPEQQQASVQQNIRFGEHYFQKQLRRFGDATLARAAYNAGPRRIEEAMAMAGTRTDVNKILAYLPSGVATETVPYTEKISDIMSRLNVQG